MSVNIQEDAFRNFVNEDGKNSISAFCPLCECKVIAPNAATYVKQAITLPLNDQPQELTDFWLLTSQFHFENIGVSNTIDNCKYLTCADCEKGVLGVHTLNDGKFYLSCTRVSYEESNKPRPSFNSAILEQLALQLANSEGNNGNKQ